MTNAIPTPSDSRDAEATASHPIWCDSQHSPTSQVHGAFFGQVPVPGYLAYDVEAVDYGTGDGAQVVLVERDGTTDGISHLTAQQARDLARLLAAAADVLDAAGGAL